MLEQWKLGLIEQYFAAEISDEGLKQFQKLVETDPIFLQETQKYAYHTSQLEDILKENQKQDAREIHLKMLFQQTDLPKTSHKLLKHKRVSFLLNIAASLTILILLSWLIYTSFSAKQTNILEAQKCLSNPHPDDQEKQDHTASLPPSKPSKENIVASADSISRTTLPPIPLKNIQQNQPVMIIDSSRFFLNTSLENQMLALNTRASVSSNQISPKNNYSVLKSIDFAWKSGSSGEIILEVYNNQKEIVHQHTFSKPTQEYSWNVQKQPAGLYYWRLLNEEDIIHIGKFYIRTSK